jgi:chemotaxis-related protein WspD
MKRAAIKDCWNRIGVRGDSSCPELSRHIHCRNCPIYSTAATEMLEVPLSSDDLTHATRHVARAKPVVAAKSQSFVVFRIGAEWLALPTAIIHEIARPRPIHTLPHRRDGVVLGLANIQGQLLVCAALGQILKLDDTGAPAQGAALPRMLITRQGNAHTVYPVDEVRGVQHFLPDEMLAVPRAGAAHVRAVVSRQTESISLVDEDLLLSTVNRSLASATAI